MEYFKTLDNLIASFRKFSEMTTKMLIVNGDDANSLRAVEGLDKKIITFGLDSKNDYYATDICSEVCHESHSLVTKFNLYKQGRFIGEISLKIPGKHNVYNALASAVCAYELGISLRDISLGLKAVKRVNGRLELVAEFRGVKMFVDFAHTPDGLEKSLQALKKHCKGRLVCVFGCGGNRDKSKRPLMGEAVAQNADFAVLTSDNPRYEDPLDIISEIERGYRKHSTQYAIVPERERAVEYAISRAQDGDVLLFAGKGGEEYQEIMGIKYLLNDNDLIKKTIRESESGS
jgi:UDP-N-acetylmuramoyl-L-alanyl-D-glutamate--2,6-diaminopimelate ligase